MHKDSFSFGGVDMFEAYGIRVVGYDVLSPALRPRKVTVPQRSGAYDFGAKYHDERVLRLECDSRRSLGRGELRELAYTLSKKNRIVLGDEPGLYYIGRIYDAAEVEHIGEVVDAFTLTFLCEPYAYGKTVTEQLGGGLNAIPYHGTAETPTRIELRNVGTTTANGIKLTMTARRDTY